MAHMADSGWGRTSTSDAPASEKNAMFTMPMTAASAAATSSCTRPAAASPLRRAAPLAQPANDSAQQKTLAVWWHQQAHAVMRELRELATIRC